MAVLIYAVLAILVVPVFPHFVSPNEFSRWALVVSIVDEHTVEVTDVVKKTHTQKEDLSSVGGRLYSNKPPGAALVAIPAYTLVRGRSVRVTLTAMRVLASTLPAILLALLFDATLKQFGISAERTRFATVALLFGTPLFAYGLLFFAHALSAFALFAAFVAMMSRKERPAIAGALLGIAVLAEYPNAIPAAILIACAIPRLGWRTLAVIAGGVPFAIVLAIYNRLAFGSIFTLSSAHEANPYYRDLAESGAFGIGMPSPVTLLHLLFDPAKGLFVFSPVLLVAFLGLKNAYRAMPRDAFVALVATPLAIVMTYAGYPNWHGGWTVGARYLVPALPFLAMLVAFAKERVIDSLLLGASVTVVAIVTLVFPFAGRDYPMPWFTWSWPMLRDGHVAPNLLHLISRPLAIAIPFALVATAALVAVAPRRWLWLITGGAIWFASGALFLRSTSPNIRSVVEEVQFEDRGAIDRNVNDPRTRAALHQIARDLEQSPPDFRLD